mgnify:CR=1 FL=1
MKNILKWALQALSPTELTRSVLEEHNRYLKAPKGVSTWDWAIGLNKAKWGDFLPGSRIKSKGTNEG